MLLNIYQKIRMSILPNLVFLFVWIFLWALLIYARAHFKYANKKNVDECYNERSKLNSENQSLKHQVEEFKKLVENLHKEIDHSKRELMEKNKYLSENTIVIERLFEVKQLSDKIAGILLDYDKNTIQALLDEYKTWALEEEIKEHKEKKEKEEKTKHW